LPLVHENGPPQLTLTDEQHAALLDALNVAAKQSDEPTTMSR